MWNRMGSPTKADFWRDRVSRFDVSSLCATFGTAIGPNPTFPLERLISIFFCSPLDRPSHAAGNPGVPLLPAAKSVFNQPGRHWHSISLFRGFTVGVPLVFVTPKSFCWPQTEIEASGIRSDPSVEGQRKKWDFQGHHCDFVKVPTCTYVILKDAKSASAERFGIESKKPSGVWPLRQFQDTKKKRKKGDPRLKYPTLSDQKTPPSVKPYLESLKFHQV